MASRKLEFSTVRELEKKTFRIFGYGGSVFAIGLVLTVLGLAIIGAPMMVISAAVMTAAMIYISMLGKEPARQLFCPYCASQNEVYQSRRAFNCDICKRPVIVTETGEPVMAEPIDTTARYSA